MILVSWDEIATRSVRTDFTLGLHGEIIFHPVKAGQFPPAICFDLFTFLLIFLLSQAYDFSAFYRNAGFLNFFYR